jgi:oligo-1,6-glucosidase/alpha-glucosidase
MFDRTLQMPQTHPWWKTTTIYQIYPRSFADLDNNGIGDLRGIISRLDYIMDLGFETIWISPFFCSPQKDFGYDVSDYKDIAPEYGTLSDADELIQEVHAREMKILFDLVLNHTSIQHPWFQESRSSRDNPKRDWYIWQDGRGNRPPNNWVAIPGGSGWHYDRDTSQYYYASFLPFQPDLNWRNPEVKQVMFDAVRFWLDKGVDGFRLDIFHSIFKDEHFRDNPFSLYFFPKDDRMGFFQEWKYTLNQPEVFELARDLRSLLDTYSPERMMVGEVFGSDEKVKKYIGEKLDGMNLVFLWELLNVKGSAGYLRDVIRHYEDHYPEPFMPVYVFGNHDSKRLISQIGEDPRIARLLALFQFTARGVPVTYYGEEIGMADGNFSDWTSLDPIGQRYKVIPGFIKDFLGVYTNRDCCRTPMQWNDGPNAGFCGEGVTPWLPVHENRKWANVQTQQSEIDSILNTYKELLKLRREVVALLSGTLQLLEGTEDDKDLLVYTRGSGNETVLVVINFGKKSHIFHNPGTFSQVLLAVGMEPSVEFDSFELPPYAGLVLGC